ncbi:hypothetical protein BpHYR1_043481 [Brachionus plicatilis]|uniref:Uncharacterized protein n=1 Tax=Brachionus plicatilis TaxID=10195 RepID=A0A3M7STY5_BRAPC|nr:hypothetical protein BpHYR1_043481 [Brachionus plicatilis]
MCYVIMNSTQSQSDFDFIIEDYCCTLNSRTDYIKLHQIYNSASNTESLTLMRHQDSILKIND